MKQNTQTMTYYITGTKILVSNDGQFSPDSYLEKLLGEPITAPFMMKLSNQPHDAISPDFTKVMLYQRIDTESAEFEYITENYNVANLYDLIYDQDLLQNAGKALQIGHHFNTHQFCGRCASPMQLHIEEFYAKCEPCNDTFYPRISPCMIVLVYRGREVLLAKRPEPAPKWYSILAGFVEAGESIEECVHREVYEEVKLKVGNIKYFNSQAWPFPNQMMVGYTAEYVSGEIEIDGIEIGEAQWFNIDDLPDYPPNLSISGQLIEHFIKSNGIIAP